MNHTTVRLREPLLWIKERGRRSRSRLAAEIRRKGTNESVSASTIKRAEAGKPIRIDCAEILRKHLRMAENDLIPFDQKENEASVEDDPQLLKLKSSVAVGQAIASPDTPFQAPSWMAMQRENQEAIQQARVKLKEFLSTAKELIGWARFLPCSLETAGFTHYHHASIYRRQYEEGWEELCKAYDKIGAVQRAAFSIDGDKRKAALSEDCPRRPWRFIHMMYESDLKQIIDLKAQEYRECPLGDRIKCLKRLIDVVEQDVWKARLIIATEDDEHRLRAKAFWKNPHYDSIMIATGKDESRQMALVRNPRGSIERTEEPAAIKELNTWLLTFMAQSSLDHTEAVADYLKKLRQRLMSLSKTVSMGAPRTSDRTSRVVVENVTDSATPEFSQAIYLFQKSFPPRELLAEAQFQRLLTLSRGPQAPRVYLLLVAKEDEYVIGTMVLAYHRQARTGLIGFAAASSRVVDRGDGRFVTQILADHLYRMIKADKRLSDYRYLFIETESPRSGGKKERAKARANIRLYELATRHAAKWDLRCLDIPYVIPLTRAPSDLQPGGETPGLLWLTSPDPIPTRVPKAEVTDMLERLWPQLYGCDAEPEEERVYVAYLRNLHRLYAKRLPSRIQTLSRSQLEGELDDSELQRRKDGCRSE